MVPDLQCFFSGDQFEDHAVEGKFLSSLFWDELHATSEAML